MFSDQDLSNWEAYISSIFSNLPVINGILDGRSWRSIFWENVVGFFNEIYDEMRKDM